MKRAQILLAVLFAFAATAEAQIGKRVVVALGTPEDKALSEIYAATDTAQKIVLLDKFVEEFGSKPDLALLADQLYLSAYQSEMNYDKMIEYGEKVLALDPDSFSSVIALVRAEQEKGNAEKLFEYGEQALAIVLRYRSLPVPDNMAPADWEEHRQTDLKSIENDIPYIEYAMFNSAYQAQEPKRKIALLHRFTAAFPDSTYAENADVTLAIAYQEAQDYPKMQDAAQKVLAKNPNNVGMLVLLADYWSGIGKELEKAEADGKKAVEVLGQAKKPEGVTDQQWQQQVNLQKGMALSALGQIYVIRGRNPQAVDAFKQANPMLKQNDYMYGRNLYRLGFTLAKMQKMPEAKVILREAISVNSPFRTLAQQTLDKINAAGR
jgi:tetratricopeptide (TPR) repeat protein